MKKIHTIEFELPRWIEEYMMQYSNTDSVSERMEFVIGAAKKNILEGTGGPFAAAIFDTSNWDLISLGINLVTTQNMSTLHAEMVAIMIAQKKLQTYDLGSDSLPPHQLVTSTEPCAMCFGAIPWSGLTSVVSGAGDIDARSIGFDEGPKPNDWAKELEIRGIKVTQNVSKDLAKSVFDLYVELNGEIYNSRSSLGGITD